MDYSQEDTAAILGLSLDSLKKYRTAAYADSQQYLKPLPDAGKSSPSRYSSESIIEWLNRNDAKRRELIGLMVEPQVPLSVVQPLRTLPNATHTTDLYAAFASSYKPTPQPGEPT